MMHGGGGKTQGGWLISRERKLTCARTGKKQVPRLPSLLLRLRSE